MNGFWKRSGWFWLAVSALAVSMILQIVLGIIAMLPVAIKVGMQAGVQGITDPARIYEMIQENDISAASLGVLIYHLCSLPVFGLWYYYGCGRVKATNPIKILKSKGIISS